MRWLANPLDALQGHLFGWVPVCLGLGIGVYFSLMQEPGWSVYATAGAGLLVLLLIWRAGPVWSRQAALGLGLAVAGVLLAGARAHNLAAPVLGFSYYGPVEGRVLLIDRSSSNALRLTLDRIVLERLAPDRTPARVRISVGDSQPHIHLQPGQRVMLTAFLSPPEPPAEPGGFDFQRMAWFLQLGAVGYSRSPVMALAPAEPGLGALFFAQLRQRISDGVREDFPTDAGGFVAAVLTNDTSGLSSEALASLRASSLAHILSISGLHMSLLAAFVFAALRYGIALIPFLALRVSSKKIAAWVALAAASFYFGLSGGAVATQRSYVMIVVVLVAVLVNRRAISLRTVAVAASLLLVTQPESLLQAGFQMSFAATIGLVAVFANGQGLLRERVPGWLRPMATVALASIVAGAVTAPYGAAAFNRVSGYGLLANMAVEPVMAFLIMPGVVVAGALAPLGLAWPVLWLMERGARWILAVSDWVAGLDGAVIGVVAPPPLSLPLITLGGLVLVLVPFRARAVGALAVALGLGLWVTASRPPLLVVPSGLMAGFLGPEGRALSQIKGEKFAAQSWLENDGDLALPKAAATRPGFDVSALGWRAEIGAVPILVLRRDADITAACRVARLVITPDDTGARPASCQVIGPHDLTERGALAIWPGQGGLDLIGAREGTGRRLWNASPGPDPKKPDTGTDPDAKTAALAPG